MSWSQWLEYAVNSPFISHVMQFIHICISILYMSFYMSVVIRYIIIYSRITHKILNEHTSFITCHNHNDHITSSYNIVNICTRICLCFTYDSWPIHHINSSITYFSCISTHKMFTYKSCQSFINHFIHTHIHIHIYVRKLLTLSKPSEPSFTLALGRDFLLQIIYFILHKSAF